MNWRKSSYSGQSGGNCVEVARHPTDAIAVRDSKNPDDGHLVVSRGAWRNFTNQIKADH
ncbi:MAG TPA: DUF397 domain-containing protein [Streptosporangiaceae bacterium]|jgi:hypothetical protein